MIIYLNKGLVLENVIVQMLRQYFKDVNFNDLFKKQELRITTEHPFATLINNNGKDKQGLFPCIVVTSESDDKTAQLEQLYEIRSAKIDSADVAVLQEDVGKFSKDSYKYIISQADIDNLNSNITAEKPNLYGLTSFIRRSEKISIEVWSNNNSVKNTIYELVRLFITGQGRIFIEKLLEDYSLNIFDDGIRGERSNNYNFDFGLFLHGARITGDVAYMIHQTLIDTELDEAPTDFIVNAMHYVCGIDTNNCIFGKKNGDNNE